MTVEEIIAARQLHSHPEGGYYREVYRSPLFVTRSDGATRSAFTIIDFLLPAGVVSDWHRVNDADETWHYAGGSPLELRRESDGQIETLIVSAEDTWKLIPAGHWQSARSTGAWSLVQCCVAPGFSFEDFEMRR